MAKQDIKRYVEGRLKNLLDECNTEAPGSSQRDAAIAKIQEVLCIATLER